MISNGFRCDKCKKEYNSIYVKKRIEKLRANKQCTTCGKEMDRKGWVCISCVTKINERSALLASDRKRNSQCVRCGTPIKFSTYCDSCRQKNNEYMKKRRQIMRGLS
jgi:hypothetical protein